MLPNLQLIRLMRRALRQLRSPFRFCNASVYTRLSGETERECATAPPVRESTTIAPRPDADLVSESSMKHASHVAGWWPPTHPLARHAPRAGTPKRSSRNVQTSAERNGRADTRTLSGGNSQPSYTGGSQPDLTTRPRFPSSPAFGWCKHAEPYGIRHPGLRWQVTATKGSTIAQAGGRNALPL